MLFKNKSCEKCGISYDSAFEECPCCHQKDRNFEQLNVPNRLIWLSKIQQIIIFLVGFCFGGYLLLQLFYTSVFEGLKASNETLYKFVCIVCVYVTLLICLIAVQIPRRKHVLSRLKNGKGYLWGLLFALILYVGSATIAIITKKAGVGLGDNQENVLKMLRFNPPIALIVMGAVGPICEELTYRVGLYTFARRINKVAAIIISALVFAFIHFNIRSTDYVTELLNMPSYIFAGVVLAIAYEFKGLPCSMTAHVVYNTFSLAITLLTAK